MTNTSKCEKCGTEVYTPVKSWRMKPKSKSGSPLLIVRLYECPKCLTRWRVVEKVGR